MLTIWASWFAIVLLPSPIVIVTKNRLKSLGIPWCEQDFPITPICDKQGSELSIGRDRISSATIYPYQTSLGAHNGYRERD